MEKPYIVTAKTVTGTLRASGETLYDAFLSLRGSKVAGRTILTVEHEGKKQERILMPALARRLLLSVGFVKEIASKSAATLFGV